MNDKTDAPVPQEQSTIADAFADDQSLETVRDILFGSQVREHDKRSRNLEKTFTSSINKLEKELDKRASQIEKKIESLKDRLDKQAAKTAANVSDQFDQTMQKIDQLDKSTQAAQVDLREDLTADRMDLEKKASGWNEDLAQQLETVHQQLLHSKTDRSTLSDLLRGMADSLADNPSTKVKKK